MSIERNHFSVRRRLLASLPLLPLLGHEVSAGEPVEAAGGAIDWPVLRELRGKVVLVDFWASWCVPCRRSFPWMNDLQRRLGARGMSIVAVNLDQERALADAFLRDIPASFRLEFDAPGIVARQFGVRAMPTSFLVDRRGQLRARHSGFRDAQRADREQQIMQLMEESAS